MSFSPAGCSEAQSLSMALYRYLKPKDGILPSPTGPLSAHMSPATIREVNKEVQKTNVPATRSHLKISGEQQAACCSPEIAHYSKIAHSSSSLF